MAKLEKRFDEEKMARQKIELELNEIKKMIGKVNEDSNFNI